jgi:UDP-N-acetylmuramate--alanine ligase
MARDILGKLGKDTRIHFVGIGGIGMSGIAEVLLNLGFAVSGSDIEKSPITERLATLGAVIFHRHAQRNVKGSDVVVVSSAIGADNPEVAAARKNGIPVIRRADMLGELMRMRTGIAVAGAHGKTTTTSLAAVVLQEAGLDPTVIVGGQIKSMRTNARLGEGRLLVAEADESDGSFVNLSPVYALITNIDAEHLDFYGGLEQIFDAFVAFANRVPFHGAVICCLDNPQVRVVMPRFERRSVTYGLESGADVRGKIVKTGPLGTEFSLSIKGRSKGTLFLPLPGRHNVRNALSVCALAEELDIGFSRLRSGLKRFEGVSRRLEIKGDVGGVLFIDDYGHHPSEVRATIETVRENYQRRLVVAFQPHRFTRTRDLHESFEDSFTGADEVFITEIYPAGERPIPGVSGEMIYRAALRGGLKHISYLPRWEDLRRALLETIRPGDVFLTLGAGNIWRMADEIIGEKGCVNER